jgi:hypothetical protein
MTDMAFTPGATYKGQFISSMSQKELVEALHDQILETRFMMKFVNMQAWMKALKTRAEEEMGVDQSWPK